ncbi:inositol monophosphatase 3 [Periophthalmus magnuspinnatus]|uniref:inositol-phosphate phosphatase n=1 Tax=Periophthalmus magnuspinnatus TaxID=409849 RepID=A0A3B4B1L2_9GOBI|nr:inositol monophosphatase 3 [Periophthalmus magnuspinnatus]
MAPMGIRLSPLGVAVFCLLGVGVLYHLYSGVISNRLAAFRQRKNVELRDLLALSVEAAVLGGKEVKRVQEENGLQEKSKGKTREGANDPLTMGDLESHRKMYNIIRNTFPEITVNSEEHDNVVDKSLLWSRTIPSEMAEKIKDQNEVPAESVTVWIDPLDATQEYTESLLKYVTTMVCVAVDGKPVIGVIHQPFNDFTAWALVGHETNVHARSSYSITPPVVVISRSHSGHVNNYVHKAFGNSTTVVQAGGAGYKVLSLLDLHMGESMAQADLYIHITFIKKWDICAGDALLRALGGHMTTLKGEEIDYRDTPLNKGGLVASVGVDHKAVVEKLPPWDPEKH